MRYAIVEISQKPTCTPKDVPGPIHESCTRAYYVLQAVKVLLDDSTPGPVVRKLIDDMEFNPIRPTQ